MNSVCISFTRYKMVWDTLPFLTTSLAIYKAFTAQIHFKLCKQISIEFIS